MPEGTRDDPVPAQLLDEANAEAVRVMVSELSDKQVIRVYDMSGGMGYVADLAAEQMQRRNLDY
ncbi:hypothetical protein J2Y58_003510 [Sphingomonas sp. BE138]|uniref:hypothetical protein n=1 Tax=Sphingomonas sp. BE138 TaxID=2817845 RepID=UPI00285BB651|nr:hypothetical protein [Sphingomonas sp. BE138]MDR6790130.1 hypothetical protein [Sphingomonas sp. BE138]